MNSELFQLEAFIENLPKIELHAHLSGSIRESTVIELIEKTFHPELAETLLAQCKLRVDDEHDTRDLNECFALFKVLHDIINSKDILYRITLEVLEDFVFDDKVMYLELRTTPRSIVDTKKDCILVTSEEYVRIICDAMEEFNCIIAYLNTFNGSSMVSPLGMANTGSILPWVNEGETPNIQESLAGFSPIARSILTKRMGSSAPWFVGSALLLSFDRSKDLETCEKTLDMAISLRNEGMPIVGIDLSGNPFSKKFEDFAPLLRRAKGMFGFPISLHFAETADIHDSVDMLAFMPDRFGHAAVQNQSLKHKQLETGIPVEICLTSNRACKLHTSLETHPLLTFLEEEHCVVLCTDDKGVFGNNLTDEWKQLLQLEYFQPTITTSDMESVREASNYTVIKMSENPFFPYKEAEELAKKRGKDFFENPLPSPKLSKIPSLGMKLQVHDISQFKKRAGNPDNVDQAKRKLWKFANNGVAATFASPALRVKMNKIYQLYKPE